jgi:hypothetical protein
LSARAAWGEVEVLWASSDAVSHGSFTDVFAPLERVTFLHAGDGHAHELDLAQWKYDKMTSNPVDDAPDGWTEGYADLRPLPHVQARIDELRATMGGRYVAIHARRLDHVTHSVPFGHSTTDQELLDWLQGCTLPVYIATDDPVTLEWFRARIPTSSHWHRMPERVHGYEIRPGSLADAVVDMFVCVGAVAFMGSWISSFSETIDVLRCGGKPPGGFVPRLHMQSADAEWYRGRQDRADEMIATQRRERGKCP